MIELIDVKKSFDGNEVLKGVSATMESGKTNLIIGTSGSGKTVLMKCMVGLFKTDSGKIKYNDTDLFAMSEKEIKQLRQKIGMLFQGTALFDSMTIEQNVMFPLNMFTNLNYRDRKKRVNSVLER